MKENTVFAISKGFVFIQEGYRLQRNLVVCSVVVELAL